MQTGEDFEEQHQPDEEDRRQQTGVLYRLSDHRKHGMALVLTTNQWPLLRALYEPPSLGCFFNAATELARWLHSIRPPARH